MIISKVAKAIQAINRRINTVYKLFGEYSDEYKQLVAEAHGFGSEIYLKKGVWQLRNTKANRTLYRKLTPFAKRITKTSVKVLERKAAKQKENLKKKFYDNQSDVDSDNLYNNYSRFVNMFNTYFESCYVLAKLEGNTGSSAYYRACELYDDSNEHQEAFTSLYYSGNLDKLLKDDVDFENELTEMFNTTNIDLDTGEVLDDEEL